MPLIPKELRAVSIPRTALFACVLGVTLASAGCSDSSSSSDGGEGDSSTQVDAEAGPPSPLGVPVPSCAGCSVCGGVLASPTTGITYCTLDCTTDADCPTGTGCVAALSSAALSNECIKTCAADADCSGGFICRSDLATPGSFCWSPYPPPSLDAGATPLDAGTPVPDAGDAAADGSPGAVSDASMAEGGLGAATDALTE